MLLLRESGSIFDKLGFWPIALHTGLRHEGFRAEYGARLRGGHINPANCAAQFLSLGFLCGWGSIWGFGAFMVPREWKPCLGNVLCCAEGFGKARGVWEGWECGRFSGVELRVFFSWGSVWRPRFPQEENSPKPEPQLKQKPCLAGWRCPKLGFRPYVQFCGVSESRNPSLGDVQPDSFSLGSGLWWVCFLGLWSGWMRNPS